MTFGSLFAGAGGFDLGLEAAGMECAFQVEIDETASSVLRRHWPDVPKFSDVRKVGKKNLPKCDVLTFGFPCQDLSVAGQRKGLQGGTRSGLFYEAVRIGVELRCGFMVFENVPGLLSSDNGRDFGRVLRHLADCGFHGGWRVLDAQHFGVAQRRRRVFGVFSRGRAGAGRCAEILALSEGVRGNSSAGREAREGTPGRLAQCLRASGVGTERAGDTRGQDNVVVSSVTSKWAKGSGGPRGDECQNLTVFPTLRTNHRNNSNPGTEAQMLVAHTLRAEGLLLNAVSRPALARVCPSTTNGVPRPVPSSLREALSAVQEVWQPANVQAQPTQPACGVRRLTPRESERLQGWPDDHTRYRDDGSEIADGPRYRMIGNGVAAPVAEWLGRRMLSSQQAKMTPS